jgi:hypothetical protein
MNEKCKFELESRLDLRGVPPMETRSLWHTQVNKHQIHNLVFKKALRGQSLKNKPRIALTLVLNV